LKVARATAAVHLRHVPRPRQKRPPCRDQLPWTTLYRLRPAALRRERTPLIHESHVQRQVRRTHPADEAKRLKEDLSHQEPCAARIFDASHEITGPSQRCRNRGLRGLLACDPTQPRETYTIQVTPVRLRVQHSQRNPLIAVARCSPVDLRRSHSPGVSMLTALAFRKLLKDAMSSSEGTDGSLRSRSASANSRLLMVAKIKGP